MRLLQNKYHRHYLSPADADYVFTQAPEDSKLWDFTEQLTAVVGPLNYSYSSKLFNREE